MVFVREDHGNNAAESKIEGGADGIENFCKWRAAVDQFKQAGFARQDDRLRV